MMIGYYAMITELEGDAGFGRTFHEHSVSDRPRMATKRIRLLDIVVP